MIKEIPFLYDPGEHESEKASNSYLMSLYPEDDLRITAYYKTHYTYQNPNELITIPRMHWLTFNYFMATYF